MVKTGETVVKTIYKTRNRDSVAGSATPTSLQVKNYLPAGTQFSDLHKTSIEISIPFERSIVNPTLSNISTVGSCLLVCCFFVRNNRNRGSQNASDTVLRLWLTDPEILNVLTLFIRQWI